MQSRLLCQQNCKGRIMDFALHPFDPVICAVGTESGSLLIQSLEQDVQEPLVRHCSLCNAVQRHVSIVFVSC